jgi:hypothetical protein
VHEELGHNIGLGHSGEADLTGGGDEVDLAYRDQSGYMVYGYNHQCWPLMCFNGAKNWQLGWYKEKKAIHHPSDHASCGPWKGCLYRYPDFKAAPTNSQEIGNLYMHFNKTVIVESFST